MTTLDEIEAAARAATQGKWTSNGGMFVETVDGVCITSGANPDLLSIKGANEANAKHIALCNPQTILALTADLRACKEALEKAIPFIGYQACVKEEVEAADQALQDLKKWGL